MLAIAFVFFLKRSQDRKNIYLPPSPSPSIEQKVKEKFSSLKIPADSQKMELRDVSGGEGFGIVTDTEILAYLPESLTGEEYKAWLIKDDKRIKVGTLLEVKGGWILSFDFARYLNYDKLVITSGSKDILEGSF